MLAGDLASKPPITISPSATIEEAAQLMADHNVGLLVVVDSRGRPVGVISERDVIRAIAGKAPLTATVDKVGTMGRFVYVYEDDPLYVVAQRMKDFKVRHVVVLRRTGELVGVISIRDLVNERRVLDYLSREWPRSEE